MRIWRLESDRALHGGGAHRRDAAFHVGGAATIDAIAADLGAERLVDHSLDADDIEVSVEHESGRVARPQASDDVGPSGNAFHQLDGETPVIEHRREDTSAITLARRVRSEGGISRIDLYQCAGERDCIAARDGHFLPFFRGLA